MIPAPVARLRKVGAGLVAVAVALTLTAGPVAAEGGGSSNSSVVGRGDILTTISSMVKGGRSPGGSSSHPRCRTVKLNDAEIEFLIALVAMYPEAEGSKRFANLLRESLINSEPDPAQGVDIAGYEILLRICDGKADDMWAAPRADPGGGSLRTIGRRMITRLPDPQPVQSPPLGIAVPLNQPVFFSIPDSLWAPVEATLVSEGIVAEVRAEPVSLRVYSGDGSGEIRLCPGRGLLFDPLNRLSPARQAANPLACTVNYRHPSTGSVDSAASEGFIGAVTVMWIAEWRSGAGPWRSLGTIPRTRVFERSVREVRTAISTASRLRHSK